MLHIVHLVNRRMAGRPVRGTGAAVALSLGALLAGLLLMAWR